MLHPIVKFSESLLLQITSALKGSRVFDQLRPGEKQFYSKVIFSLAFIFQRQEREERNLKNSHKTKREMQQVGCNTAS